MKRQISTKKAPAAAGPYCQAVKAGNMIFISGQIPLDPETGAIPEGAGAQAVRVMENLREVCKAAGAQMSDVVKTTVYLKNMNDFSVVNEVYARYFEPPFPARACIEAARLPKDVLIEIEAMAVVE